MRKKRKESVDRKRHNAKDHLDASTRLKLNSDNDAGDEQENTPFDRIKQSWNRLAGQLYRRNRKSRA